MIKVACGPYGENYEWTETLMEKQVNRNMMQGLALHYYTVYEDWGNKGSATDFGLDRWFGTLNNAIKMDELLVKHSEIMDKYDPDKRIGLAVDEWGNWFDVEPGTNTGFLYQQNSLRDAVSAAVILNIFNNHADRVNLANIAQTVNVLQSMILTKGEKMILTPTYYVFKMYKAFHESTLLPIELNCENYSYENENIKSISSCASINEDGTINISLVNLNHEKDIELSCQLKGSNLNKVSGKILTSEKINDFNDFDTEEKVKPRAFKNAKFNNNKLTIKLPAKSVVVLHIN